MIRPDPFADSVEFQKLVRREPDADLLLVALELARDVYPDLALPAYLAWIEETAQRVRQRCPAGARAREVLQQLNWVLFVEEGFRGNEDDYYDPRNSYLNEVIDRKSGIPISLSTLYMAIAGRLGVPMAGVNLPAHFVTRLVEPGSALFVDPYHEGAFLDAEGCRRRVAERGGPDLPVPAELFDPCSTRDTVARMLRNLKGIHLRESDLKAVLTVQRRLTALLHEDPDEWRDLGVVCIAVDRPGESIDPLQRYLAARPGAPDSEQVAGYLRVALRDVAGLN